LRDFYELPKALLPVAFFTVAYEADLSEESLRRLFRFFSVALLLVCLYAWAQWMSLGIAYVLNRSYSGGEHIDGALRIYRRVYATMGNANVLGELLTWSIVAFTLAALCGVGNRLKNISMAFVCLITLAMTGSRYGLLNTALGLGLIVLLLSFANRRRLVQISFLLVLFPVFAWTVATVAMANRATSDRLRTLKNPLETDSLRQRLDDVWKDAYAEIQESPFLGHGPAKTRFTGIVTDSEYLDVLKQFGIVGFLLYIAYFLFPLFLLGKGLRAGQRAGPSLEDQLPATFLALRLSFVMGITAMVMNVGMSTFYNAMLQGFLWMWLGLGARSAKSIVDASPNSHPTFSPRAQPINLRSRILRARSLQAP
jgi:O-antigen ligase